MNDQTDPALYLRCLKYWPYRASLEAVLAILKERAPKQGVLADVMCGPGYLLGEILKIRPDLTLTGIDKDARSIDFARLSYPSIDFEKTTIFQWRPPQNYDVVTCTGALHHVSYDLQDTAVKCIWGALKPSGFAIISDCYVADYSHERTRRIAAVELGSAYLRATIENNAPQDVIQVTLDILGNDMFKREHKTSLKRRLQVLDHYFRSVTTIRTWPGADTKEEHGDFIHICSN